MPLVVTGTRHCARGLMRARDLASPHVAPRAWGVLLLLFKRMETSTWAGEGELQDNARDNVSPGMLALWR
jgi:hypothetical protein